MSDKEKKIFSLDDINKEEEGKNEYVGGKESGIFVEERDLVSNILKKAKNSHSNEIEEKTKTTIVKTLVFWKNGFCIDDGNLLCYDSPENILFLKKIEQGFFDFPGIKPGAGEEIELKVIKKTDQTCDQKILFPGKKFCFEEKNTKKTLCFIKDMERNVLYDKPITKIQIKLSNGAKRIFCFNTDEKVYDLINFIEEILGTEKIEIFYGISRIILQKTNETIEQLELQGCVLFVKNK